MIKLDWSNTEFLFALVNENRNIIEFFEVKPIFTTDGSFFIVETNEIMYEAGPWEIYIKPVTVPTFTQEMADAGTLPSVGMECLCSFEDGEWEKVLIDFISEILAVVTDKYSAQYSLPIKEVVFKPLTPPIELIDGKAYQFELSFGDIWIGYYGEKRNSFFSDILLSNKLCGKNEASNIQLLEVKS